MDFVEAAMPLPGLLATAYNNKHRSGCSVYSAGQLDGNKLPDPAASCSAGVAAARPITCRRRRPAGRQPAVNSQQLVGRQLAALLDCNQQPAASSRQPAAGGQQSAASRTHCKTCRFGHLGRGGKPCKTTVIGRLVCGRPCKTWVFGSFGRRRPCKAQGFGRLACGRP